jgi:predicted nucleic acid-binding protein
VTVFLDTSTILAACWSNKGLSRLLVEYAPKADWRLVTADYCISEVEKNVRKHPSGAVDWVRIVRARLESVGSVYVIDRPIVFDATKDKPVILSAIGSDADYLVTSDTTDFAHVLGTVVYGVKVRTPKSFLQEMGVVA